MSNTVQDASQQPLIIPEEKQDVPNLPPQVTLFGGQVILNPTISKVNFFSYLVHSSFIGIIFIPVGLLQSSLFKNVYQLEEREANNLSSVTTAITVTLKLLLASIFGYICDKYGRKFLVGIGAVIVSATVFYLPNITNANLYPWYYILQVIQELGFISLSTAPLLADYIDYETKGRVAGISSVLVYSTSFVATFIFEHTDLTKNVPLKYHQLGIVGMVLGGILMLGLKGGSYHKKLFYDHKAIKAKKSLAEQCPEAFNQIVSEEDCLEEEVLENQNDNENIPKNIKKEITRDSTSEGRNTGIIVDGTQMNLNASVYSKEGEEKQPQKPLLSMAPENLEKNFKPGLIAGLKEAKNPWILTAYLCSFLMMSNVALLNYILVNYITHLGSDANQAVALANKRIFVGIFTGLFFGFFADKYNKFKMVIFVIACAIIGVLLLILTPTAYNVMAYAAMVMFGFSCSGLVTLSSQLQAKYANAKYRASVGAVSSMSSVVGTLALNILGVYLMNYNIRAPYYIFLGSTLVALAILALLYSSKKEILNRL